MGLIERRWTNTVIVDGETYVLAQEAQVELRDTNRAAWDRVKGAVDLIRELREPIEDVYEDSSNWKDLRGALKKVDAFLDGQAALPRPSPGAADAVIREWDTWMDWLMRNGIELHGHAPIAQAIEKLREEAR